MREQVLAVSGVLCIGPIYVDVNCLAFPCEDGLPIEVETIGRDYEVVPGGSAVNFARFGRRLGLSTILAGKIGTDAFGDLLSGMLRDADVGLALKVDTSAVTDVGINFVAPSGASVMAVAGTASDALTGAELAGIVEEHESKISYVYLGGGFKLPGLLEDLLSVVKPLQARGVKVILDHGRVPGDVSSGSLASMRSLARFSDIYLPSRGEFLALWGADDVEAAVRAFQPGLMVEEQVVVVKDGSAGAFAFTPDRQVTMNAYDVRVRNTVGAGDSFNAGFVTANTLELDLYDSVEFACAVAALTISTDQLPDVNDVNRLRSEKP
ncbi:carbohydrate kinase family protein [Phytohabitans rumicis]|uniref:carbohydrate kinase family protein n=3 Tax=Phytohabitans rumicis TaxID=1076125 RepID=UPI0031EF7840